ncbi:elongation factor G [Clostridium formicaceticum]|uniref:Elongation factor G n=1 Tax=Clostridium formicaceticum TaxID=1497 RepID=A0AAC9RQ31_9CLOT|nr:elongation factor G [Clostridium formicaceticum]AOY75142.1 translation elongation factor G [Clostridium formicaceticum]ARE89567.1 Elongation factor G [Clostridium formicaceticum]
MKIYEAGKIRNIALLGHGGCGKTTLTESALYTAKLINRIGKVEDGNTVSDFDKEEIARKISINTSVIPMEWEGHKINFIDTPGYFDFVGEVQSAIKVAGGLIILVDATSGIEVGTEKAWDYAEDKKKPTFIFINKMDRENADFDKVLNQLREKFGKKVAPFQIPLGEKENFIGNINVVKMIAKEYDGKTCTEKPIPEDKMQQVEEIREMLMESVAETDEVLLEKYFNGEAFTQEEIQNGLRKGIISGEIVPVLCGATAKNIGIHSLLNMINDYSPSPMDMPPKQGKHPHKDEIVERSLESGQPFSAQVFKTIVDPYIGKISLFKVISGSLKQDMEVLNANKDEKEKIGNLFLLRGKNQIEIPEVKAGDIGAVAKLQHTNTGDTLCSINHPILFSGIAFDQPQLYLAVEPKARGDEEKISSGLQRLAEEDPSFSFERNVETKQTLIRGHGELHIKVITSKLKNKFGVEVELSDPIVPYRETIKGKSDVQGKHKKQSGGHGQYGDVKIRFEPAMTGFEFAEEIFGGSVPKAYIPAVEKGLRECLECGTLAGYPVVNIKAILYDGSYHDVDSSEMAFKIAASLAFKKGMETAKPVLLEPIVKVNVIIPEEYMGDIMGDLNKRRGRIVGMEPQPKGMQLVVAEVPQSEMFKYAIDLRSMTQARGIFTMEFVRYEEVPQMISEKVVEAAKAAKV